MDHHKNYNRLLVMFVLHFIAMYALMYAMVDTFANVHFNHNQFYMAALMAAPMVALELLIMGSMYPRKKLNVGIILASILILASSLIFIRGQVAIGDEQFLKSMIPHHAGALLMCQKAHVTDPEIKELCSNILLGQQSEIDWMEEKLKSLK